jgi:hypothetical protein
MLANLTGKHQQKGLITIGKMTIIRSKLKHHQPMTMITSIKDTQVDLELLKMTWKTFR